MWKQSTTRRLVQKRTGSALSTSTTPLGTSSIAAATTTSGLRDSCLYPPVKTSFEQRPYSVPANNTNHLRSNSVSYGCRTLTTCTSGSTSSSRVNEALVEAFARLEQDSRALLNQELPCPNQIEELLIEWERALLSTATASLASSATTSHYHVTQAALERMDDLWQVWWQDTDTPKKSSRPFEILLTAHADHGSSTNTPARALTILLAWNDTFAGDWFQAPTRKSYDAVLKAHCHAGISHVNYSDNNYNDPHDNDSQSAAAIQTADLALEVVQKLEEWGGDGMGSQQVMAPGWETYAQAIQCVAKVCHHKIGKRHALVTTSKTTKVTATTTEGFEADIAYDNCSDEMTYQEHLEQMMDRLHQHYLTSGGATGRRRQTDGTLQTSHLSNADVQLLLRAWGDAMQCFNEDTNPNAWKGWADDWNGLVRNNTPLLSQWSMIREGHALGDDKDEEHLRHVAWLDACTTAAQEVYNHVLRGTERARAIETTIANLEAVPWGDGFSLPLTHHYNIGIVAFSNVREAEAQQRKRNLLKRMQHQHERLMESGTLGDSAQVTRECNSLMIGYLDAGETDGMMNVWEAMATTQHVHRDRISYSVILKALAEQSSRSPEAAMQAYSIWKNMVSVDEDRQNVRQHYGWVMVALSKSRHRDAAKYCQEVFDRLQEESRGNPSMKPELVHYTTMITTLGWRKDLAAVRKMQSIIQGMKAAGIEPDLPAYAAVLATMARTQSLEGAQKSLLLLNELDEVSREPGKQDMCPNLRCYTSVIYAWARSGSPEASTQCSALYSRLEEAFERSGRDPAFQPNNILFCALIEVEIKSGRRDSGDRARVLLNRLERYAADGLAEYPDSKVYTKIMDAYVKSGDKDAVAKSQAVFDRMKEAYEGGNSAAKPTDHSITTLMQAWAKSNAPDKATQTWNLLNGMNDAYCNGDPDMKPTAHAFAAVLDACARTSSTDPKVRREVIEIALKTMTELDKTSDGPNERTFFALFQVIGRQVDDMTERTRIASMVFQRCCQGGFVTGWVIETIQSCIPSLYKKLPVNPKTKRIDLPPEWKRNWKRNVSPS